MALLKIDDIELLPFDLAAKPAMDAYLANLDLEVSDYTFANNYLWLSSGSGFYSLIEDTFCFFVLTGGELSMILPPLGERNRVWQAMDRCFDLMNRNNHHRHSARIEYVHEQLVEGFVDHLETGTPMFEMLADYLVERSLVDYVYEAQPLIELKGSAYENKRNEINKFRRIHPEAQLHKLDIERHGQACLDLFYKWVSDRMRYMPLADSDRFMTGIEHERMAIRRMVRDYNELNLTGLVLEIDGVIKGFTVGERITDDTASVLIEKTDFEVLGCAQYIFREFTKQLVEEFGAQWINVGDDMGFENLKKVKMSYRPAKLISKYTIYQK